MNNMFTNKLNLSEGSYSIYNILRGILIVFLVFYSSLARPNLPLFIKDLFESPLFKILFIALIAFVAGGKPGDFTLALILSIAFVVTAALVNEMTANNIKENFESEYN